MGRQAGLLIARRSVRRVISLMVSGLLVLPFAHAQDELADVPSETTPEPVLAPDAAAEATTPEPDPAPVPDQPAPELSQGTEGTISTDPSTSRLAYEESLVPAYKKARPNWGTEALFGHRGFGSGGAVGDRAGTKVRAITLRFEFQPEFLQKAGVFSLGPTFSIYPVVPGQSSTEKATNILSGGATVRYQGRFFREQPVVPFAGYQFEYLSYRLKDTGDKGRLTIQGPFAGLMFLLNVLAPDDANEFYMLHGVSRSYLVAEARFMSGSDPGVSISGAAAFLGIRIEY